MMKRFFKSNIKAIVALLLIVVMACGLAACGNNGGSSSGAGGTSDSANSAGKSMEEVLYAASENMQNAESMTYTMDMEMTMKVFGVDMNTVMTADVKTIQDPLSLELIGNMDMGSMGSYDMEIYTEPDGDKLVMYTGMDTGDQMQWMKTKVDLDSSQISQYDAQSNIQVYIENAKNFSQVGEEEINGVKAVRFDGTISGESIGAALEESGMNEQLAGSGIEDPAALYGEMGDIPVSFWVDTEKELIVKYSIDMSEAIQKMMAKAMEQAEAESEEAAEIAGLLTIERSVVTMTITGINNVEAIVVPPEAIENAEDMDI